MPTPLGPKASANQGYEVFVADGCCGGPGQVIKVDPATGSQTVLAEGGILRTPFGLATDPMGHLYAGDNSCCGGIGGVIRVDRTNGAQTIVTSGLPAPEGPSFGPDGSLYVTEAVTDRLYRIDRQTGAQTVISEGGSIDNPVRSVVGTDGSVYVTDLAAPSEIIKIDPQLGQQTIVSTGGAFGFLVGITIGPDGNLYVTNGVDILRVNPSTGAQTIVSTGNFLTAAVGLAFAPNGMLYVADRNCCGGSNGGVLRIDPATGSQSVVSSGGEFDDPDGIVVVPTSNGTPAPVPTPNNAPAFGANQCGLTVMAATFKPATVSFSATDATGQAVTMSATGLPGWAEFTSTPGNPAQGTLTARPGLIEGLFGWFLPPTVATITAADDASPSLSATCEVTLRSQLF